MSVSCRACGREDFEDYAELARHISLSKKGHRRGKKWAASYLLKVNQLNQKKEFEQRAPLTEEEKENKRDTRRELSGQEEVVTTFCPACKTKTRQRLPVEYSRSPTAWRRADMHVVMCPLCAR